MISILSSMWKYKLECILLLVCMCVCQGRGYVFILKGFITLVSSMITWKNCILIFHVAEAGYGLLICNHPHFFLLVVVFYSHLSHLFSLLLCNSSSMKTYSPLPYFSIFLSDTWLSCVRQEYRLYIYFLISPISTLFFNY